MTKSPHPEKTDPVNGYVRRFSEAKAPPSSDLKEINQHIQEVWGCSGRAWIKGTFTHAEDDLPKGGFVRPFLGLSMQSGDETLVMDGAHLTVKEGPFDEIEWHQDGEGNIKSSIDAFRQVTIDGNVLADVEQQLRAGLRRFLLGESANAD